MRLRQTPGGGWLWQRCIVLAAVLLVVLACGGGPGGEEPGGGDVDPGNGDPGETPGDEPGDAPADVHVRRNVASLSAAELDTLRAAIAAMQARADDDASSWLYQANIHGASQGPVNPAWNSCQHGSWYFLSWHRMYLYFMEKLLRDASGDPDFALPYWDYSEPGARQIPEPYRTPATAANPLFVANRNPSMNAGGSLPPSSVSLAALDLTNFSSPAGSGLSFGGQEAGPGHSLGPHGNFESTPHDAVHVDVGGGMASFVLAARDPVFWLHHCNIDRLWEHWLARGDGRANPSPPAGDPWLGQSFEFFDIDAGTDGEFVSMTGAEIVDTVAQLDYRYDDLPAPAAEEEAEEEPAAAEEEAEPMPPTTLASRETADTAITDEPVTFALDVVEEEGEEVVEGDLNLRLEGVTVEEMPDGHYEVYVNLPEGETPEFDSPYYVGNLSFFGLEPTGGEAVEEDEAHSASYHYSLAELERKLRAEGEWTGEIRVTLVKSGPIPPPDFAEEEAEPAVVRVGTVRVTRE